MLKMLEFFSFVSDFWPRERRSVLDDTGGQTEGESDRHKERTIMVCYLTNGFSPWFLGRRQPTGKMVFGAGEGFPLSRVLRDASSWRKVQGVLKKSFATQIYAEFVYCSNLVDILILKYFLPHFVNLRKSPCVKDILFRSPSFFSSSSLPPTLSEVNPFFFLLPRKFRVAPLLQPKETDFFPNPTFLGGRAECSSLQGC